MRSRGQCDGIGTMATRANRQRASATGPDRTGPTSPTPLTILTPTFFEYGAVRCLLPKARVVRTGISLSHWSEVPDTATVIVCGLAGALDAELTPGTIVIPERVGLADGRMIGCDAVLTEALCTAARALRFEPDTRPMLTAPTLVTGAERNTWAQRGFAAVDMEMGLLDQPGIRLAGIRVILDTPSHEISGEWLSVRSTVLRPALWAQLLWMGWKAPSYSLRAARVLKAALALLTEAI